MASALATLDSPIPLIDGHIAEAPTTLRFKNHGSGGSTITCSDPGAVGLPETLFKIDARKPGVSAHRRAFKDAEGNALFDLRKSYYSQDSLISRPGEESPLALIAPRASFAKDRFDVFIRNDQGGKDDLFEVRGQDIWKKNTYVYHGEKLVMQTRLINYMSIYAPFVNNQWDVYVGQGMDVSLAAVIMSYLAAALFDSAYYQSTTQCVPRDGKTSFGLGAAQGVAVGAAIGAGAGAGAAGGGC